MFAPPTGRGSGVAVLFYPGGLVDVQSYAVLASQLAGLGHAVVLMGSDDTSSSIIDGARTRGDRTGARARAAAAAARAKLGLPLEKVLLAGHSQGGITAMQALNASLSAASTALPIAEIQGLGEDDARGSRSAG